MIRIPIAKADTQPVNESVGFNILPEGAGPLSSAKVAYLNGGANNGKATGAVAFVIYTPVPTKVFVSTYSFAAAGGKFIPTEGGFDVQEENLLMGWAKNKLLVKYSEAEVTEPPKGGKKVK